jgi:DNA-binding transcriptional MerR regulator
MEKSPEAFRTISEVAGDMDLPQHVLRFWETRFPQIKPLKRGGGRRYYRPDDVVLLRAIKQLLYGEGYTIKGVQKLLREQGAPGLARSAGQARDAAATPPGDRGGDSSVRSPDAEIPRARIEPSIGAPEVSRPEKPETRSAPAPDLASLRAILADMREAERILAQARAV